MNKFSLTPKKPWEKQERYNIRVIHHFQITRAICDPRKTNYDDFDNAIVNTQTISYLEYYDDLEAAIKDYQSKILVLKDIPEAYCPLAGQCKILHVNIELRDKEDYGLYDYTRDSLYKHGLKRIHPDKRLHSNKRSVFLSYEYKSI